MSYTNILPDPFNNIKNSGKDNGTTGAAPGFATLKVSSTFNTILARTNSGRAVHSSTGSHIWKFSLSYNLLTREQFEPLYNFLQHLKGKLTPFYVNLPQARTSQSTTFSAAAADLLTHTVGIDTQNMVPGVAYKITAAGTAGANNEYKNDLSASGTSATPALNEVFTCVEPTTFDSATSGWSVAPILRSRGQDNVMMSIVDYTSSTDGSLIPGDFFTVTDTSDTLHTKLYRVTRVETNEDYHIATPALSDIDFSTVKENSTANTVDSMRVHFSPPLQRDLPANTQINYIQPRPRVILKNDSLDFSINSDNLYTISLDLEEIQK